MNKSRKKYISDSRVKCGTKYHYLTDAKFNLVEKKIKQINQQCFVKTMSNIQKAKFNQIKACFTCLTVEKTHTKVNKKNYLTKDYSQWPSKCIQKRYSN